MEQAGLSFAQGPTWPLPFADTYQQLEDFQSWPDQDVISRVNALANDTVVSPSPDTGKSWHCVPTPCALFSLPVKRHPSKISTGIQMVPALV